MNVPRTEELLTTKQLALHYGFSVRWVNRWVALGMPRRVIGGHNRFLPPETRLGGPPSDAGAAESILSSLAVVGSATQRTNQATGRRRRATPTRATSPVTVSATVVGSGTAVIRRSAE